MSDLRASKGLQPVESSQIFGINGRERSPAYGSHPFGKQRDKG